jgi:hypothetical protein
MSRMSDPQVKAMARRASANADKTSPLRRVIGHTVDGEYKTLPRLLLACGHVVRYPSGAWGDQYSPGTRRRCIKCAQGAPLDAEPTP